MRRDGLAGPLVPTVRRSCAPRLLLVACGGRAVVSGSQHTIYVHGGSLLPRGGENALVQGTLATHNGCVVLAQTGSPTSPTR
jgi:hypothetical protein